MSKQRRHEEDDEDDAPRGRKAKHAEEIDLDEVLDGLDEAEVTGRLPKLRPGTYRHLKPDAVVLNPDGYNGTSIVLEFTLEGSHSAGEHVAGQRLA